MERSGNMRWYEINKNLLILINPVQRRICPLVKQ